MGLLAELRRAWAPVVRGCLICVAGAIHRAYTGGAAARVGAAGPRLPYMRGRRSTQSLLAELRRAWAPLARGCLICVAGAVHRASWRSCGARGRRWPAGALYAWQAQYTEPPGGAAARVGAAGPRLPFAWQAQYTSQHNSSQLITYQLITAPLLTPLLTPHLSHQNPSQLHFSHLTSQVHFSHLTSHTSPKFTLSLDT